MANPAEPRKVDSSSARAGLKVDAARPRVPPLIAEAEELPKGAERVIGSGPHGTVYFGRDDLENEVAYKVFHSASDDCYKAVRDAVRNSNAALKSQHSRIPKTVDVTRLPDGRTRLTMDYVAGPDLARVVEDEGIIPVERLVPLALDVARTLQFTHERGIYHLDLKPSNVLVGKDQRSGSLTDFGIAEALAPFEAAGARSCFVSPEVHRGKCKNRAQADVWSLGALMYYLLSRRPPVPLDSLEPQDAVREPIDDLARSLPYVSPDFWRMVQRALSVEPAERHADAAGLARDLETYLHKFPCPSCGSQALLTSLDPHCNKCGSASMGKAREALTQRRAAETALADCQFDAAVEKFESAKVRYSEIGGSEAVVERLAELIEVARSAKKEHGDLLDDAGQQFEKKLFIRSREGIHAGLERFSRSRDLRDLRDRWRSMLVDIKSTMRKRVDEMIRNRRFAEAESLVKSVILVWEVPEARAEIEDAARARGKRLDDADMRFILEHDVRDKEHRLNRLEAEVQESIDHHNFEAAVRGVAQLRAEFPSDSDKQLHALERAQTAWGPAMRNQTDDLLEALIKSPSDGVQRLAPDSNLNLDEALTACRTILADFPAERYPSYSVVEQRVEGLVRAARSIREFVNEVLPKAREAHEHQRVDEECRQLARIEKLVRLADLFEPTLVHEVRNRFAQTQRTRNHARECYETGQALLKENKYDQALAKLEEAQRLDPNEFGDIVHLLENGRAASERVRQLRSEVPERMDRMKRGECDVEAAVQTLNMVQSLRTLTDSSEATGWYQDMTRSTARFVTSTSTSLRQKHAKGGQPADGTVAFLQQVLIPLVGSMTTEFWSDVLQAEELRVAFCETVPASVFPNRKGLQPLVATCAALIELLVTDTAAPVFRQCVPGAQVLHPAQQMTKALVREVRNAGLQDRRQASRVIQDLVERLKTVAPPMVVEALDGAQVEIRDKTNPSTLETLREFVASHRLAITAVTAIAIGAMVGWWYSESDALQRRVRGELTSLDMFRGEEQGPLAAWLGADADVLATRNSLLQVWNWVRRVAKQDRQIADAVSVFRDSEVEELGQLTPDLQALFARDMKDAVLRSAAHAIVAHPGTGAGPYTGALAQLRDLGTVFAAIPAAHSVFSDSTAALGGADGALPELFLRIPALVNEGKAGFLEDVQGVPGSSPERELFLQELRRRVLSALWERALRASGGATEDFETLCLSVFQGLSHKMFAGIEPQSADIRDPIARVIWEAAGSLGQGTTGRR